MKCRAGCHKQQPMKQSRAETDQRPKEAVRAQSGSCSENDRRSKECLPKSDLVIKSPPAFEHHCRGKSHLFLVQPRGKPASKRGLHWQQAAKVKAEPSQLGGGIERRRQRPSPPRVGSILAC